MLDASRTPTCAPRDGDAVTLDRRAADRPPRSLLGLVGGILQLTAVSQITIFGVPADLSPLLVASVGLLCGSVPGALLRLRPRPVRGHRAAPDARRHLARAARASATAPAALRELRDPAHGLVPVAVGAAATAVAAIGFAVLQFLLGVDAPVSLLLVRQILLTIVLNTLLALPGLRALPPRPARRYLPDDPRRRRRRAYTTGGLSPLSRASS